MYVIEHFSLNFNYNEKSLELVKPISWLLLFFKKNGEPWMLQNMGNFSILILYTPKWIFPRMMLIFEKYVWEISLGLL